MATHNIAQNLRDNNTNWENVKQAIEDMGVSTSGLTTADYDDAIRAIVGSQPVLDTLNVTPATTNQTIVPPVGTDGYNEVNVAAVDNTIDSNITQNNIRDGIEILGIVGNYSGESPTLESITEDPDFSNGNQVVTPSSGYDGISQVTFNRPSTLIPNNVKKDVNIAGIVGTYEGSSSPSLQSKTLTPDFSNGNVTVGADSGYDGLSQVIIQKDSDLIRSNVKKNVELFGITGNYDPQPILQTKSVTPTTSAQQITPDSGWDALAEVNISAVTASIDQNIQPQNIKNGVSILNTLGTYTGEEHSLDNIYDEFVELAHTTNLGTVNGLVCINNTLYMYNNNNIFEYDDTNNRWTSLISNVGSNGVEGNSAVAIGTKIVWAWSDSWNHIYYKYYDVNTGTASSDIDTSVRGILSAIETDGTYLYAFDYSDNKIVRIDISNNTVYDFYLSNIEEVITTLKWFHEKLYGITKTFIYEIDVNAHSNRIAYRFNSTSSVNRDAFVSGAGLFVSTGVFPNNGSAFTINIFDGTNLTFYKTTTNIYFRNGTYCICNGKLYQLGGYNTNPGEFTNKFSEIGNNMSRTLVINPSQNDTLIDIDSDVANVFVTGVNASIDSDIIAENIKDSINILGCIGDYAGDGSTNKTYNFTGEYADRSPVEYEWTVNDTVKHVNIKNVSQGTWNQVSKSNTVIQIKRSSNGSYETLSTSDWDLVITGSSTGNYYYQIDFNLNEYICDIKITFTDVYRVSAVAKVNAKSMTYYGDSVPSSSAGYTNGDYYCVHTDAIVSNTVVRKIISQYILLNGTWTQII